MTLSLSRDSFTRKIQIFWPKQSTAILFYVFISVIFVNGHLLDIKSLHWDRFAPPYTLPPSRKLSQCSRTRPAKANFYTVIIFCHGEWLKGCPAGLRLKLNLSIIVLNLFLSNKVYIFHIRVPIGNWYPLRSKIDLISKLRRTSFFKRVYLSMEDRESV